MEGATPGLRWEWEFIIRNVPTHKVFLLTYPDGFPARNEWRATRAMLEKIGVKLPSDDPGGRSAYRFRDEWEGELLLAKGQTEDRVAEIVCLELFGGWSRCPVCGFNSNQRTEVFDHVEHEHLREAAVLSLTGEK